VIPTVTASRVTYICFAARSSILRENAPILTYEAVDIFEVLKYCDQDLTLHHHIEIWNQSALEEDEEPEPESDPLEFG
jgi:hypothetical protein